MAALMEILPPVKSTESTFYNHHSNDQCFNQRFTTASASEPKDFGDGGAFPEIHVAQYPLGMGKKDEKKLDLKTLPLTVDSHGKIAFDAIVKQNENASKIVYSQHKDLVPKFLRRDNEVESSEDDEEMQKEIEETTRSTKAALEKIMNSRLPKNASDSKFIKYKPLQQSATTAFNSGANERIIRMVEMPVDPLQPSKFKHNRVPKASGGSPPVPIMHSPPCHLTVKDQQDWKIPPCVSNWKNPKGYTIPLEMRLAANGRGLQEVQINDNFPKLSEALFVAEQIAREVVAMRSKVQKEMLLKEKERKEGELRALAQKALSERIGVVGDGDEREGCMQRENIREERRRERKRERRLEANDAAIGKKSKITRDRDRDVSEKAALGMASTGGGQGGEVMYDQRLFNQEKGMESGYTTDDQYNVYDKGLFNAQSTMCSLYKPRKDTDAEMYGGSDEQLEKVLKTDRFKPNKKFSGAPDKAAPRNGAVEFHKSAEEADPFGLDLLWS